MRVISILIFKWKPEKVVLLSSHIDVSFVGFFMRSTLKEHILFHSRLICSRTSINERQTVQLEQNIGNCHVYIHPTGIAGAVIADAEYPQRVAFSLLNQVLRIFIQKFSVSIQNYENDTQLGFPEGDEMLQVYQNPVEADKLLKIQKDLNEVKGVMLRNLNELLQRGEKLDDLMQKTSDLSKTSVEFYRRAKAQNKCCQLY